MEIGSDRRLAGAVALLWLLTAAAVASAGPPAVGSAPERTGEFEARWNVQGTRDDLDLGRSRSASIYRHLGQLTVVAGGGLVENAFSKCIGLSDTRTGGVSRCVWIDATGDEIYSEIERAPDANGELGRGRGRFVGGTGRFTGLEGGFELTFVMQPEPGGEIQGESISMKGRWRIPGPAPAAPAPR